MNKILIKRCLLLLVVWAGVSAAEETAVPPVNLTGGWSIVVDDLGNNAVIFQTVSVFSGGYKNKDQEHCAIAGRLDAGASTVGFHMICPQADIEYAGKIENPNLITGRYKTRKGKKSSGEFRMLRQ
jgi:hypothetical protein